MSVTPSPIGGFAAQFFDNNGVILSGGKIYTYAAGTTTPQATYTSASGVTPHANPIILDSAGRVPGGEIWLTDGLVYKFVIETATAILIGTYDNITGINSNFVNYTIQEEVQTATAGQTVFNLTTINYTPATNSLTVYIDGVNQYVGDSYLETDSDTVTFTTGVHVGGEVKFTTAIQTTTGAVDASIVTYDPPFTGGVLTNVEDKLAQYVSVKDFGAVGDGVADDSAAIQAAIDSGAEYISIPEGTYRLTTGIVIAPTDPVVSIVGLGLPTLLLDVAAAAKTIEIQTVKLFLTIENLILDSTGTKNDAYDTYGIFADVSAYLTFTNIRTTNFSGAGIECRGCVYIGFNNFTASSCGYGLSFVKSGAGNQNTAMTVNRAYISGCERGFYDNGGVDIVVNSLVMEYCGNASTTDGALHLVASTVVLTFPYWEANYRNVVSDDSIVQMQNIYGWGTATAPDIISYTGVASSMRGWSVNLGYEISTANIKADTYTNRDLTIGENLVVPVAGGSVSFGGQTMETIKGTAVSTVWTTVKALTGQSGDGAARKSYRYAIYAGTSDLTTGYDSGSILNGVIYSDSGATPAWLRIDSNNLQVNITNTSYGLFYGCRLTVNEGIGAP
jgi:hypothetical protein